MSLLVEEYRLMRDGMRYGFAVGKVRVLATRLLDRSAFERLIDASSFLEQKRILSDTPYGRYIEAARTASDVDSALDEALEGAYAFLNEAELPEPVKLFFRVRYDYLNLRAALKAHVLGAPLQGLLIGHGTVEIEQFAGPLEQLPDPLGEIAREMLATEQAPGASATTFEIDAAVDRAFYARLGELAAAARSPFLKLLAARLADLGNLKTLVRAGRTSIAHERIAGMLNDSGSVPPAALVALYRLPQAEMFLALERRFALRGAPLTSGLYAEELDVVVDDDIVSTIKRAKRAEPGPEDVIAYVRARESEVQALRVALLGKLAGIDVATMHRRLRAALM